MESPDTLTSEEYLFLRIEARQALVNIGVRSNPGFTDYNIISALRSKNDLPPLEPQDEWSDDTPARFQNGLAEYLGLERPFTVGDIAIGLRSLKTQELRSDIA